MSILSGSASRLLTDYREVSTGFDLPKHCTPRLEHLGYWGFSHVGQRGSLLAQGKAWPLSITRSSFSLALSPNLTDSSAAALSACAHCG